MCAALRESTDKGGQAATDGAWHRLANVGDVERLTELLGGGQNVNARGSAGRTALHRAAARGHTETVELLLSHGADPSLADRAAFTPLHWAALMDAVETGRLLLLCRADVDAKTNVGE